MNTKQKLSYMVVGGIIGVVGMVIGMSVLSVSAARDNFGDIECTSLRVVDKDRRSVVEISAFGHGGIVRVRGHDGMTRAALSVGANGGVVAVSDNDGMPRASLYVRKNGQGGGIAVVGRDGKTKAGLNEAEHGGVVAVYDSNDEVRAGLYVKAHGGVVTVHGNEGNSGAAVLHVNEYGNGVLSLWDKRGYRLK